MNKNIYLRIKNKQKKIPSYLNNIIKKIIKSVSRKSIVDFLNIIFDENISLDFEFQILNNKYFLKDDLEIFEKNTVDSFECSIKNVNTYMRFNVMLSYINGKVCSLFIIKKNLLDYTYDSKLLVFNSNIYIEDKVDFTFVNNNELVRLSADVFKCFNYNLRELYDKNLYFLFPQKILELSKRIQSINNQILSIDRKNVIRKNVFEDMMKKEVFILFRNLNKYLDKLFIDKKLSLNDIRKFNKYFILYFDFIIKDMKNSLKNDIEKKLKEKYI
ncbi:hypothetical protein [Clostridium sp. BJN0001]|uniref:hypothetical protein n=1 Tax=Clostridium sp. BJN0001 TaxID=2930219 RepID=UPI001FD60695|nr:hypothetical protein [Clostridium sp. BJN0001]